MPTITVTITAPATAAAAAATLRVLAAVDPYGTEPVIETDGITKRDFRTEGWVKVADAIVAAGRTAGPDWHAEISRLID
jgi:hypothetical protein